MMKNMTEKLPPVLIERPKMPKSTWDALKAHIIRDQVKKKQALEQTQEFERLRREREKKKKEQALTLEETKSEIARLEKELILHKEGKHMLFQKLKKVIHQEQGLKDSEKSSTTNQLYLQPPSRHTGSSIYQRPMSSAHAFLPFHGVENNGSSKRSLSPVIAQSSVRPHLSENTLKKQKQLVPHYERKEGSEDSKKISETLYGSNFHSRDPDAREQRLIQSIKNPFGNNTVLPSGASIGVPQSSNLITPSASPTVASSEVSISTLIPPASLSQNGLRMTPVASPLTAPLIPSTSSEIQEIDGTFQLESSSKKDPALAGRVENVAARPSHDRETSGQVQATAMPSPLQPWLGHDPQGSRAPSSMQNLLRPTPTFAPTGCPSSTRYGSGFARPSYSDGLRFNPTPSDSRQISQAPNVSTAFTRLGESGIEERLLQPPASYLPSNTGTAVPLSTTEPATTAAPFFIPSHIDPRVYSQHQRDQVMAHFHHQAYAAAAIAASQPHLPQPYRYGPVMQGYPNFMGAPGVPIMSAHPLQMHRQSFGKSAESYFEK